jgi:hypothetical protein
MMFRTENRDSLEFDGIRAREPEAESRPAKLSR